MADERVKMERVRTIAILLDPAQAEGIAHDLTGALAIGSGVITLMTTIDAEHEAALRALHAGDIGVDEAPAPDLVVARTVFTIGLDANHEDFLKYLAKVYEVEEPYHG